MSFQRSSALESQPTTWRREDDASYADDPEFRDFADKLSDDLFALTRNVARLSQETAKLGTKHETARVRERVKTTVEETSDKFKELGEGLKKITTWPDVGPSQKFTQSKLQREFKASLTEFQHLQKQALEKEKQSAQAARTALQDVSSPSEERTPLPTIEEEVWKALVKTRLINPIPTGGDERRYERIDRKTFAKWDREGADVNWDGCEYSKCGRTDRGVSAFGQVIGVRVRSNKPLPKVSEPVQDAEGGKEADDEESASLSDDVQDTPQKPFNDLTDELPYIQLLNRVLPPDIRVYAWCPNPPEDFSARFSCKERRYKYFFTNPCFAPVPGSSGQYKTNTNYNNSKPVATENQETMREGWLDIEAMRKACKSLVGLHDFRNFCKIDASKQLTNFQRRIFHADIEEVSSLSVPGFLSHPALSAPYTNGEQPKLYSFTLHGSAFLWHQVRSLVAILFLVGQGLESPSLVPQLLDITANPQRPKYEMASDAPLVLWDCIFPHAHEVRSTEEREHGYQDRLEWIYIGDEGGSEPKARGTAKGGGPATIGRGKWGRGGVIDDVWEVWRGNKIDETLSGLLLDKIANLGQSTLDAEVPAEQQSIGIARGGPRVFDGGDLGRAKGNYMPVLQRERQESVEVVNEKYRVRRGIPDRIQAKDDDGDE